jgi:hypothetical protein
MVIRKIWARPQIKGVTNRFARKDQRRLVYIAEQIGLTIYIRETIQKLSKIERRAVQIIMGDRQVISDRPVREVLSRKDHLNASLYIKKFGKVTGFRMGDSVIRY